MNYFLYKAMNKHGIDNFKIEEIEKCEINKLNEREIYWISYYDSFNKEKGYNLTLGGGGKKIHNLDENEIIKQFKQLNNVVQIAKIYGCSSKVISQILKKHNINIKTAKDKGNIIQRYSLEGELLEEYKSLREAGRWVVKEGLSSSNNDYSESLKIRHCIETQQVFLNFIWECDNYKIKEIKKIKERKNKIKTKKIKKIKKNNHNIDRIKNESIKEELMMLVRVKSFTEIGKIYNVSDNTIRKWCKKYYIPFRREDIVKISDEDWEKECNLSKEQYERRYVNKQKITITDQEIINKYLKLKSIKSVSSFYHKDVKTVKSILIKNNIKINTIEETLNNKYGIIKRCDIETEEVLQEYKSMNEAIDWVLQNKDYSSKRTSCSCVISRAYNKGISAYGFKWKRE